MNLTLIGRYCFGAAVAGSGILQVVVRAPVRLAAGLPPWLGTTPAIPAATGVLLILIGGAMVAGYRAKAAALLFGALMLAVFLTKGVADVVANPGAGYVWTNPAKMLALLGGALVLGGRGEKWPWLAPILLGIFLVICGAQHFVYAGFVDKLVPAWMPPSPRAWTCFTAVALLAGGVGVVVPATRRLAGLLAGVMIFLWVFLVHLPLAVQMKTAFEVAGIFEALALAGVAWLVAGSEEGSGGAKGKPAGVRR